MTPVSRTVTENESFCLSYLGNIGVEQLFVAYYTWLWKELCVGWEVFFSGWWLVAGGTSYIKGVREMGEVCSLTEQ